MYPARVHVPWIEIGCSLFAALLCVPLALGRIPRNGLYGMRTTRTMSGTEAEWLTANRVVGRTMMLTCLASAVIDGVLAVLPVTALTVYIASLAVLLAAVLAPILLHRKLLF